MLRESLVKIFYGQEQHFRWRGTEVTRIENLSDAVFAFSIALIVMSGDVPTSFHDLIMSLLLAPAFGICFVFLWMLWSRHYVFFRRYGLADTSTFLWNAVLMFLTLVYVYPLRFLFGYLIGALWYVSGILPKEYQDEFGAHLQALVPGDQAPLLMVIYSAGYVAVSLTFVVMYMHVLRRAEDLELDARELVLTRHDMWGHYGQAGVAVLSIIVAVVGHPAMAGWLYFLLFPVGWFQGEMRGRAMKRLEASSR